MAEGFQAIRRIGLMASFAELVITLDKASRMSRIFRNLWQRAIWTIGAICELPTSPESAIKIDEICRDLRIALGKVIFALQQLGLCRGDIQEVGRTLRVTLPGGLQSGLIFRDGAGDVDAPALGFAIIRQGVVDLLPGPQDSFLKEDSRFSLS